MLYAWVMIVRTGPEIFILPLNIKNKNIDSEKK
jgi:hypothetical protein